jgi:hypothetical protein
LSAHSLGNQENKEKTKTRRKHFFHNDHLLTTL